MSHGERVNLGRPEGLKSELNGVDVSRKEKGTGSYKVELNCCDVPRQGSGLEECRV